MPQFLPEFYTADGLARSHASAMKSMHEHGAYAVEAAKRGDHVAAVNVLCLCMDNAGWAAACVMGTDGANRARNEARGYAERVISILGLRNKSDETDEGLHGLCRPCPPRRKRR